MGSRDIKQSLAELHEELEKTEELDDDLRSLLMDLDSDIHELLSAGEQADQQYDSLRERLEALEADFAARHPNTERFFRELINALGRMGI